MTNTIINLQSINITSLLPIVNYRTMKYLYILISLLFYTGSLFALNSDLSIGGSAGWEKIETWNNVKLFEGKRNFSSLGLKSAGYKPDDFTDLLINFDDSVTVDASGNYIVESQIENSGVKNSMGSRAGVFRGLKESLILQPGPNAVFSGNKVLDNFSIEFWLNPSRFSENPVLFSYQGTLRNRQGNLIPQELTCSMENRKISWKLNNIFYTEERNTNIDLQGLTPIIPDAWHHHLLRFDGSTGIIEYLVDGQLEAIQYASKTGVEDGTIFYPLISALDDNYITIGENFIGYIDEFRISKSFIKTPVLNRYQGVSGYAVTEIIDLGRSKSILKKITVEHEIPKDSAIFFHYNISDNMNIMYDEEKWIEFNPSEMLYFENKGRYLRIKMDIQADGEETRTPSISKLNIVYEKNLQPLAPSYLHTAGGESSVTLTWPQMSEPDIEGYLIYYGTEKEIYFGTDAVEGASPLTIQGRNITNITIHGLENGQLYHFSVAAYDTAGTAYPGILSSERTCRPSSPGKN